MSRNISLLSGKKDDKNSLFGKISVSPNETTDAQLAGEYNLGAVSYTHLRAHETRGKSRMPSSA